jgi:AbrB family transcriptional regulator (stage V sporulation protein T)
VKATGIVRRIDDLGRVVIPKEIRRTMRIREGDPLEIYTSRDGEVIFKKYSLLGGVDEFASQLCDVLNRTSGRICAVSDRDSIIAVAGGGRRELLGKRITAELDRIMEGRKACLYPEGEPGVPVCDSSDKLTAAVAAPILSEGDVLGLVLIVRQDTEEAAGEVEFKLAQAAATFLGRHMES